MKPLKLGVFVAIVVALPLAVKSADQGTQSGAFVAKLSATTSAELPAMAAEMVKNAKAADLNQTTAAVVKAAVGLNPAAAPAIVGSIAHASPAMAPTAAGAAVVLVPNEVLSIARAAASAAPTNAAAIVEAICQVSPGDYREVAEAVAQVVPGINKQILTAIGVAIPGLTNAISQVLASGSSVIPSLNTLLLRVDQIAVQQNVAVLASATPANPLLGPATTPVFPGGISPVLQVQGPSAVPPQVPFSGSSPIVNPTNGVPSSGGHNYSSP